MQRHACLCLWLQARDCQSADATSNNTVEVNLSTGVYPSLLHNLLWSAVPMLLQTSGKPSGSGTQGRSSHGQNKRHRHAGHTRPVPLFSCKSIPAMLLLFWHGRAQCAHNFTSSLSSQWSSYKAATSCGSCAAAPLMSPTSAVVPFSCTAATILTAPSLLAFSAPSAEPCSCRKCSACNAAMQPAP